MTTENDEALQIVLDAMKQYEANRAKKLDARDKKFMEKLDALQQRIDRINESVSQ